MKILAIETSCDETAIALLEVTGELSGPKIKILGNSLFSQAHLHEKYGGVYPNLAKREHQKNLPLLLEQTLREAREGTDSPNIDCIAVTQGPGLEPALWTGITFAEELGKKWGKPVIPIDHMEGHIWSVLYGGKQVQLPAIALLVSGGHTELVLVRDLGNYEILGHTLDDAVGEAFDKVARMLDLPYPGGPKISHLAQVARSQNLEASFKFPRPMINSGDLNFSYSGLKTAVLYKVKELGELTDELRGAVACEFEDAAIEVLISKTEHALEQHPNTQTLIVGGGVAANNYLRAELDRMIERHPETALIFPTQELSTDNAVMIGITAFIKAKKDPQVLLGESHIKARGNLSL